MTQKRLPRLEAILKEVGKTMFSSWEKQAEKEYRRAGWLFKKECCHHAFVYEQMIRRYDMYKEIYKASKLAGREVLE